MHVGRDPETGLNKVFYCPKHEKEKNAVALAAEHPAVHGIQKVICASCKSVMDFRRSNRVRYLPTN